MAEAAGLAVGAVGLAGLFSSCLECIKLLQTGRSLGRDYILLERKYKNQVLRFDAWGVACGLSTPQDGMPLGSPPNVPNHCHADIEENLSCIKLLFEDSDALKGRYGLRNTGNESSRPGDRLGGLISRIRKTRNQASMRDKASWAIYDKRKFETLVNHLKDFIDALELLTKDIGVPERQLALVVNEIEAIDSFQDLQEIEDARNGENDIVSDAASRKLGSLQTSRLTPSTEDPSWYTAETHAELPPLAELDITNAHNRTPQNERIMANLARSSQGRTRLSNPDPNREPYTWLDDLSVAQSLSLWRTYNWTQWSSHYRRLTREIRGFITTAHLDNRFDCLVSPIGGSLEHLLVTFTGPTNTPFEGGLFHLRMIYDKDHPFRPPKFTFLTKIFHPNIDSRGQICMDQLGASWSPVYYLHPLLRNLISLLDDPGVHDPLVPEIAAQFVQNYEQYSADARVYMTRYADPQMMPVFSHDNAWSFVPKPEPSPSLVHIAPLLSRILQLSFIISPMIGPPLQRDTPPSSRADGKSVMTELGSVLQSILNLGNSFDFKSLEPALLKLNELYRSAAEYKEQASLNEKPQKSVYEGHEQIFEEIESQLEVLKQLASDTQA